MYKLATPSVMILTNAADDSCTSQSHQQNLTFSHRVFSGSTECRMLMRMILTYTGCYASLSFNGSMCAGSSVFIPNSTTSTSAFMVGPQRPPPLPLIQPPNQWYPPARSSRPFFCGTAWALILLACGMAEWFGSGPSSNGCAVERLGC